MTRFDYIGGNGTVWQTYMFDSERIWFINQVNERVKISNNSIDLITLYSRDSRYER